MGRPQKTPFSNKKTKIICRYCGPEGTKLNRQSYRDHLKVAHNDSSGNLREWGQSSLFAFGSSPRKRMEAEGVQGEEIEKTGDNDYDEFRVREHGDTIDDNLEESGVRIL